MQDLRCAELQDNQTVHKLGWLLHTNCHFSLLQYTAAMAVLPESSRLSVLAAHTQNGRNLPSTAIYPRPDSNSTALSSLTLGPDLLLVAQPGRTIRLTLHEACGLPLPDSSFDVLSTQAQVCLATEKTIIGPIHQVRSSIQDNGGHHVFAESTELPNNPIIIRLPEEPKLHNDPFQQLVVLIEVSATLRRRVRLPGQEQDATQTEPTGAGAEGRVRRGPMLSGELKKKNKSFGYRTRWVTWDWGKGLSLFEDCEAGLISKVQRFVPLSEITGANSNTWRDNGFSITTSKRSFELAAESTVLADLWISTVRADLGVNGSVAHDQQQANEVFIVCLGWVALPVAQSPVLQNQMFKLNAGSYFSPQSYALKDLKIKNDSLFDSSIRMPELACTLSAPCPADVCFEWLSRLPVCSVYAEASVPFVVLFRHVMADKLHVETTGFHWSLVQSSDDPAITWFPTIIDSVDSLEAFHRIWAKHHLGAAQMAKLRQRQDIEYLISQWRSTVLQLYPALVDCPVLQLDRESVMKERAEKLTWFVNHSVVLAMGADTYFTKPFHTQELVCDPVHALVSPHEGMFLSATGAGHYGDIAVADIMILLQRLLDLLGKGQGTGGCSASFALFFEAALTHADLRELSRFGYHSLEALDTAFRQSELMVTPQDVQQNFSALIRGDGRVTNCKDPHNVSMCLVSGTTVFFTSSPQDARNWKITADFFFDVSQALN